MHFNGRQFSSVPNSFLSLHSFLVEKSSAKINFFEEKKKGLECSFFFIELKCRWLQVGLADLKKTTTHRTFEFLLRVDFYASFKILHFSRFLKIISSTC